MDRRLVALLVVLLLGIAAAVAMRGDGEPEQSSTSREQPAAASTEVVAATGGAAGAAGEEAAQRVPVGIGGERAEARLIELLVLRSADRQPVADADVWVLGYGEGPPAPPPLSLVHWNEGLEDRVVAHGKRYRTAGDGTCRVPVGGGAHLVARAGELVGDGQVGGPGWTEQGRVTIGLEEQRTLRLRAVGPAGEPVPGLQLSWHYWGSWQGAAQPRLLELGWTDAEGRLQVRHAQKWLGGVTQDPTHGVRRVEIRIRSAGFDAAARAVFDVDAWPEQELMVPVPASGSVVVQVRGERHPSTRVRMRLADAQRSNEEAWEPLDESRRARFAQVALHQRYLVHLEQADRVETQLLGPTRAGQEVECTLDVLEAPMELRFRLVDEQDQPLTGVQPAVTARFDSGGGGFFASVTDEHGVGALRVPDMFRGKMLRALEFVLRPAAGQPPRRALLTVDRVPVPGSNELGSIRMVAPALLATGQVVGAAGIPLHGFTPFVEAQVVGAADGRLGWDGVPAATIAWSEGGRFELRGETSAERLRLMLVMPAVAPAPPVEFLRGSRDLRIELQSPGSLELEVLLDDGFDLTGLTALLSGSAGQHLPGTQVAQGQVSGRNPFLSPRESLNGILDPRRGPVFRWTGLLPGPHRIELCTVHELLLVDPMQVEIRAGEVVRPRTVDLRGKLRKIRIDLQDDEGTRIAPEREPRILFRPSVPREAWPGMQAASSMGELITAQPVDVAIFAAGYRRADLQQVFEDRTVRLQPGPRLSLRFDLSALQLPAGAKCYARVWPTKAAEPPTAWRTQGGGGGLSEYAQWPQRLVLDSSGAVHCQVIGPGEYRVTLVVDVLNTGAAVEPRTIQVLAAPYQEFQLVAK